MPNKILKLTPQTRTINFLRNNGINPDSLPKKRVEDISIAIRRIETEHNSFNESHITPIMNLLDIGIQPTEISEFLPYP